MERRMKPREYLPPEVKRFLDKKTFLSRQLVKKCMSGARWNLLAATLSKEEKIYIVDEKGFTFLVWVPNAKVVPNCLEGRHYRRQAGHIRNQLGHIICWAYGSSDAVSAERVLKRLDTEFQPLDTRYLVRNACPEKLLLRKDKNDADHCCYGGDQIEALKFIQTYGIPREQNIVFDCTQDPPPLGDEELIHIDRIEVYETLEEVFVALQSHPVLATMITFEGWSKPGEDVIYEGPLNGAPFSGYHVVLIVAIETINGVAVAVCKSSNGIGVGRDGYIYVSLGVMFMLIAVEKKFPGSEHLDLFKSVCDTAPQYLLKEFCWPVIEPVIEDAKGSNSRKRKAGNLQSRGADDSIPLSSELAREQAQLASEQRSLSEAGSTPLSHNAASSSDLAVNTVTSVVPSTSSTLPGHASSPIQAGLAVPVTRPPPVAPVTPKSAATSDTEAAATSVASNTSGSTPKDLFEDVTEELEEKQTLKEIVHDKRYGALRTLGERKQAFNEEYILDLEKEEEELRRVEKEHVRRAERKNRDAFRTLLEEHVAAGILTAKTYWLDYWIELKDLPQYQAVASNTSGSTPKDLFEDVTEELEKQYHEDKSRVKDAMKSRKISMISSWLFEDFKSAISEDLSSQPISDINLKLIYDDLVERLKEKEEKEARKLQRLAEEFTNLLRTFKEITAASNWEDTKQLIEESQEYRSIGDETVSIGLFEEYITSLQEKAKEKERKHDEEKVWGGNPAKFMRKSTDEEIEYISQSAKNYINLAQIHASENSKSFEVIEVERALRKKYATKNEDYDSMLGSTRETPPELILPDNVLPGGKPAPKVPTTQHY